MTTAEKIKAKYFKESSFVDIPKEMPINGIDVSKAFDNVFGYKRVQFKDGSQLRIFEAVYPDFLQKMEEIKAAEKAKAAKKTAEADTKESRYCYIQRYITLYSIPSDRINICLIEEAVVKYPERIDFEEAIHRILS